MNGNGKGLVLAISILAIVHSGCGSVDPPAVAMSASMPSPPVDAWPAWRGGVHQGVSPSSQLLTEWTSDDVHWRVRVPGRGNSSPIVWDGQIFLTTEDGGDLQLMSFDRHSGQARWAVSLGAARGPSHGRNGHASATPATNGEVVVVSSGSALYAIGVNGRRRWSAPLLDGGHKWGAASSPVVCGSMVIQLDDNEDGASQLAAFELATGEPVWRAPRRSQGSWTTPAVAYDNAGQPQWAVVNGSSSESGESGEVIAYSLRDGAEVWKVSGTADIPCPTALLTEDLVISSTGSNGPLIAIGRASGEVAWRQPAGGAQVPTGVLCNGLLFLLSDHGALSCLDPQQGDLLWKQRLHGRFSASLLAAGGHVYATSETGDVHVITADRTFTHRTRSSLRESCWATPAVAGDDLIFRTESHLWCIGPAADADPDVDLSPLLTSAPVDDDALLPEAAAESSR